MPIRPAKYSDLRPAAEAAAAAFDGEELFGALLHPHRHEYWEDYVRYFERDFRVKWLQRKYVILVAVDEDGKVVGMAKWERQGDGGRAREVGRLDPRSLIHPLASLYTGIEKWIWPNRAANPAKANVLQESFPLFAHHWEGGRRENWYLDLLAVHPASQGKMYGRELVQWGIDEAGKEGVPASVISAKGKERFYGRFGYVEVGRSNVGPLAGLEGGAIMFNMRRLERIESKVSRDDEMRSR